MALIGSLAAVRAQTPPTTGFATAFSYLDDLLREGSPARARLRGIAPGRSERIELGNGVFAIEQVYEARARADSFFESHLKYIDVQVVVEGDEVMEVIDAARIVVKTPYDADRDFIAYADTAGASRLKVHAGEAAIFFPIDVHMPGLRPDGVSAVVRKTVVKVPSLPA